MLRLVSLLMLLTVLCVEAPAQNSALVESTRALYQGDYRQAIELAGKHLGKYPNDARARVILARALLAQGGFQGAFQELEKALASDPRNVDALYYQAITSRALSQQEYQRLFVLAPDSERVHQLMAEAALVAENPTEAEAEFQAALKANPRSVEVLTALGELKRSQSKFDEAITFYARAREVGAPNYTVAYGLGVCYTYKQNYSRAVENLRQAVSLAPDSAVGRFALGNVLFQWGQTEAAIPELNASLKLEPRLKQAYFLLGRAYQKLGRQEDAKSAFSKLDELNRQEAANQEVRTMDGASSKPASPNQGTSSRTRANGKSRAPKRKL